MNPKYPIYIISKGRAESRFTSKALEEMNVPYHIVVEPQEYNEYSKYIDQLDQFKVENVEDVKDKIYEMYSMRYIMQYSPFENIIDVSQEHGHNFDDSVDVIKYWLSTVDSEQIKIIRNDYLNFINSKKFKMIRLKY